MGAALLVGNGSVTLRRLLFIRFYFPFYLPAPSALAVTGNAFLALFSSVAALRKVPAQRILCTKSEDHAAFESRVSLKKMHMREARLPAYFL